MGACLCCCPELKAMMGTIDTMNKTMDSVKLITDETQYVVGEVKGFVGGIKTKCEDLETVLVDDVKSVIDQIRGILDTVPKMPEVPAIPTADGFNIADYIPGLGAPTLPPALGSSADPTPVAKPVASPTEPSAATTPLQMAIASQANRR